MRGDLLPHPYPTRTTSFTYRQRLFVICTTKQKASKLLENPRISRLVGEGGFEPPKSVTTDLQPVKKQGIRRQFRWSTSLLPRFLFVERQSFEISFELVFFHGAPPVVVIISQIWLFDK